MDGIYRSLRLVEEELDDIVESIEPHIVYIAAKDICKGGKRLRPALVLLSSKAVSGEISRESIRFAAGVELVHISSLIADDIIDRSELRRGNTSVHNAYGHEVAVLTSNILLGKALEIIDTKKPALSMAKALRKLGEGEAMELSKQVCSVDDYLDLAYKKTASLFIASCQIGSISGGASEKEKKALSSYGKHLGIGFQIRDDILDDTSTREKLGKPVEKDSSLERPSMISFIDKKKAQKKANKHANNAKESISKIGDSETIDILSDLADFAVKRKK